MFLSQAAALFYKRRFNYRVLGQYYFFGLKPYVSCLEAWTELKDKTLNVKTFVLFC